MKFDEIKRMSAWEILKLLQKKTRRNANLIKENSRMIKSVLKGEVELISGRFNIAEVQSKTNELIKENGEYLKLHNQLLTFMRSMQVSTESEEIKEFASEFEMDEPKQVNVKDSFDEMFDKTVLGSVEYNENHPYYDSDKFRDRLLKYYTEHEEYEKCALLVKN